MSYVPPNPPPPVPNKCKKSLGIGRASDGSQKLSNSPAVSLNNGQLSLAMDIMSVAAVGGGGWELALNYLSGMGINSVAGVGVNFTQNPVLTMSGTTAQITGAEDIVQSFSQSSQSGTTTYYSSDVPQNVTGATLVRLNTGAANEMFTLTDSDGTVATYSGLNGSVLVPGRLLSTTDRYGNTQSFAWVMTGGVAQLASATDGYGRTASYSYYGSEYQYKLQQVTDYLGQARFT